MAKLILVIGDKRYSSWSMRPWLALKQAGLPFDEIPVKLRQTDSKARILEHSPSGKVPLLKDGPTLVWESLAICEYVAELACAVPLWPEARGARALARAVSHEMHGGFGALREHLSMDVAQRISLSEIPPAAQADIARVQALWNQCRSQHGAGGPFLFGRFSVADAMFAPVATRFRTYGIALDPVSEAYVGALYALPTLQEWIKGGEAEAAAR